MPHRFVDDDVDVDDDDNEPEFVETPRCQSDDDFIDDDCSTDNDGHFSPPPAEWVIRKRREKRLRDVESPEVGRNKKRSRRIPVSEDEDDDNDENVNDYLSLAGSQTPPPAILILPPRPLDLSGPLPHLEDLESPVLVHHASPLLAPPVFSFDDDSDNEDADADTEAEHWLSVISQRVASQHQFVHVPDVVVMPAGISFAGMVADELSVNTQMLSLDQSCALLDEAYNDLQTGLENPDIMAGYMQFLHVQPFDPRVVQVSDVKAKLTEPHTKAFGRLLNRLVELDGLDDMRVRNQESRGKIIKMQRAMTAGHDFISGHIARVHLKMHPLNVYMTDDVAVRGALVSNSEDLTPVQRMLLRFGAVCDSNGYRRYREDVMEQIILVRSLTADDGEVMIEQKHLHRDQTNRLIDETYKTHAWRRVSSITDLVLKLADKDTNFNMWLDLTASANNYKSAADLMAKMPSREFSVVKPNRHTRSFQNGVMILDSVTQSWCSYRSPIPNNSVACKYFDRPFSTSSLEYAHWYNIPTPALDGILRFQIPNAFVMSTIYSQLGRLLYQTNECDRWQVLLFIRGVANSGKSTIGRMVQKWFQAEDVAVMASNIEPKFGLAAIVDKMLFICFEVTKQFGIARSDFQSLISGEELQIAAKFKTAQKYTWKVPGIMFGNELGPWSDSQGSIARRLFVCDFNTPVVKTDVRLEDKLDAEMPNIIFKCQQAYMSAVREYGNRGLWECVPKYFREVQARIARETNPVAAFLTDENIFRHGAEMRTNALVFFRMWREFGKRRGVISTDNSQIERALRNFKCDMKYNNAVEIANGEGEPGGAYVLGIEPMESEDGLGSADIRVNMEEIQNRQHKIDDDRFLGMLPKEKEWDWLDPVFSKYSLVDPATYIDNDSQIVKGDAANMVGHGHDARRIVAYKPIAFPPVNAIPPADDDDSDGDNMVDDVAPPDPAAPAADVNANSQHRSRIHQLRLEDADLPSFEILA